MRKTIRCVILGAGVLGLSEAQSPVPPADQEQVAREVWMQQNVWRATQVLPSLPGSELERSAEAHRREVEFAQRANRFVKFWTEFAQEYNTRHVLDVKAARKAAAAFHELENGEGWPKANRK